MVALEVLTHPWGQSYFAYLATLIYASVSYYCHRRGKIRLSSINGTAKSRQYNISYAYSGIVPATAQPLHHTHSDQNEQICTMHYGHVYANALVEVEGALSQRITLELPGKEGGPSDFGSKKELPDRPPLPMSPLKLSRLRTSTVQEVAKRQVDEATITMSNWS